MGSKAVPCQSKGSKNSPRAGSFAPDRLNKLGANRIRAHLVEKDILPIPALRRELFQIPILADTVLLAELLPELASNCT